MTEMKYVLSTMWAQQKRFDDIHTFVRAAGALGYDAIEVSHSTPHDRFERLTNGSGARLSSIHAPAPRVDVSGRHNSELNLASLDEDERTLAIEHTKVSIDHAAESGARFVVVHLGGIGNAMFESERKQRRLFDSGTREGPEVEALRRETLERRGQTAPPYLDRARETLEELVAHARERGVAIGLENRLHHHEIPLAEEALVLLADQPPELAGYWHDVGHAEVQARLGYIDKLEWLETLSARTIGAHLHDVDGIGDHRAPGRGDVEWEYIAKGLPKTALRVFEINQTQPDGAVANAIAFLRERKVVS
jgi:sugar phosphate isomerase/epimerase